MPLTEKVKAAQDHPASLDRIEALLKRLEKFDDIRPKETVWSEQRMMEGVRYYIQSE